MKIIEVRDGFIKINAEDDIFLSSFVLISGQEKQYVAQVTQVNNGVASAKILFILKNNELEAYDKTLPSTEADIKIFTSEIIDNSLNCNVPIIAGKTQCNNYIKLDISAFNKKTIISIDEKEHNNTIVKNLVKQFANAGKKTLIIDTLGVVKANKYVAGKDFKLQLNSASLAFLYEDCLNDATADSKSLIIEIFKDLSEYSKTVSFVPFKVLKAIVDDMVDKSHIFKLLVLKNKLTKFNNLGYFATEKKEIDVLDSILNSKCAVIDVSNLDAQFQNRYLAYIYEKLASHNDTNVILELSNTVSKRNLKNILTENDVATTFVTHSQFKYLNDIKNFFDNFILSPSLLNNKIFSIYSAYLRSMEANTSLIVGEGTNYIPFVSKIVEINELPKIVEIKKTENIQEEQVTEEIPEDIVKIDAVENIAETSDYPENVEIIDDSEEQDLEPIEEVDIYSEDEVLESVNNSEEDSTVSNSELIESINKKSEEVISDITSGHELPEVIDMFEDEEELNAGTETESVEEQSMTEEVSVIDEEYISEDNSSEQEYSFEIEETDVEAATEIYEESDIDSYDQSELVEVVEEELNLETTDVDIAEEYTEAEVYSENIDEDLPIDEYIEPAKDTEDGYLSEMELEDETYSDVSMQDDSELYSDIEMLDEMDTDVGISFDENIEMEELAPLDEISVEVGSELYETIENIESTDTGVENSFDEYTENTEFLIGNEPIAVDEDFAGLDEIVELDPEEIDETDVLIDISDEAPDEVSEIVDNEIINDVDKMFTTRKDDDISESDLDFIDELNGTEEPLTEVQGDDLLEELGGVEDNANEILDKEPNPEESSPTKENSEILETKGSTTPIVPVYDADIPEEDMVMSDPIQQGDAVTHAKYGAGVVEKMIKYGNKTLFSINFDNIGRRLLDPTLTEIKKI